MTQTFFLLIDAGNSRLKWQLIRHAQQRATTSSSTQVASEGMPEGMVEAAPSAQAQVAAVALLGQALAAPVISVSNETVTAEVLLTQWRQALAQHAADEASVVRVAWVSVGPAHVRAAVSLALHRLLHTAAAEPLQVVSGLPGLTITNRYQHPAQLGADRWCAALGLAALNYCARGQTHLIVSAGTATTVDVIAHRSSGGLEFCGGWILPGVRLMVESLQRGTQALDYSLAPEALRTAGVPNESQRAITQGVGLAQVGFVAQLAAEHGVSKIWLHGGDAAFWQAALSALSSSHPPVQEIPQLLFAGLAATLGQTQ